MFFTLFAVALLAACGSSPTGDGGNGNGNVDTRTIKTFPLLEGDIQEIFTRSGCTPSNCHGDSMQGGLGLASVSQSFMDLVNVPSEGDPSVDRVEPGDAVNSYLWLKVSGTTAGTRMPLGGPDLDNIDLTNIMNWINTGAPLN
jgi:hypothetical protein